MLFDVKKTQKKILNKLTLGIGDQFLSQIK